MGNPHGRATQPRGGDAGRLGVLMATAFVDMVGALMIIPLLPFYAERFGASALWITILVSAFSAMQLVSAPLWGRVSDRYGRKPALLIGLGASVIAYTVFAFADDYWLLLASRLVQGAGGGTTGVLQAYVADSVEPRKRAKALGWLSASTNLGVVLGPVIGSVSTLLGPHAPGMLAAGLAAINMVFAWRFLNESHAIGKRTTALRGTTREAVMRVLLNPGHSASRLIVMYAVAIGAFYGVTTILVLLLNRRFGVTEQTVWIFFSYMGGLSVLLRVFMVGPVVDRFGEAKTNRLGAALLASGLVLIPFVPPLEGVGILRYLPLGLVIALLPMGTALTFPAVTALLSRVVHESERGLVMGVQQTYGGIARVIYPPFAGWAWDNLGMGVPFWTSAVLVSTTILISYGVSAPDSPTGDLAESVATSPARTGESAKREAAVTD